jgi:hypothetical protein
LNTVLDDRIEIPGTAACPGDWTIGREPLTRMGAVCCDCVLDDVTNVSAVKPFATCRLSPSNVNVPCRFLIAVCRYAGLPTVICLPKSSLLADMLIAPVTRGLASVLVIDAAPLNLPSVSITNPGANAERSCRFCSGIEAVMLMGESLVMNGGFH